MLLYFDGSQINCRPCSIRDSSTPYLPELIRKCDAISTHKYVGTITVNLTRFTTAELDAAASCRDTVLPPCSPCSPRLIWFRFPGSGFASVPAFSECATHSRSMLTGNPGFTYVIIIDVQEALSPTPRYCDEWRFLLLACLWERLGIIQDPYNSHYLAH